jgi:hypothetical protein
MPRLKQRQWRKIRKTIQVRYRRERPIRFRQKINKGLCYIRDRIIVILPARAFGCPVLCVRMSQVCLSHFRSLDLTSAQ